MTPEKYNPTEGYEFAKHQWSWVLESDHVEQLSPRDPHGFVESELEKGFNFHPAEARFVSGLALDSVLENNKFL